MCWRHRRWTQHHCWDRRRNSATRSTHPTTNRPHLHQLSTDRCSTAGIQDLPLPLRSIQHHRRRRPCSLRFLYRWSLSLRLHRLLRHWFRFRFHSNLRFRPRCSRRLRRCYWHRRCHPYPRCSSRQPRPARPRRRRQPPRHHCSRGRRTRRRSRRTPARKRCPSCLSHWCSLPNRPRRCCRTYRCRCGSTLRHRHLSNPRRRHRRRPHCRSRHRCWRNPHLRRPHRQRWRPGRCKTKRFQDTGRWSRHRRHRPPRWRFRPLRHRPRCIRDRRFHQPQSSPRLRHRHRSRC